MGFEPNQGILANTLENGMFDAREGVAGEGKKDETPEADERRKKKPVVMMH